MFKLSNAANVYISSTLFFIVLFLSGITSLHAVSLGIFKNDTISLMKKVNAAQKIVKKYPDSVLILSSQIVLENQKLLDKTNETGSLLLKAEAMCLKGRALRYKGELSMAELYLDTALIIFTNNNHSVGIAKCSHELGNVYFYFGKYDASANNYKKACFLRDSLNLLPELATSLTNLGIIYSRLGQIDSAEYFHKQSLHIREELQDTMGMTASLNNLGNIYSLRSDFNKSLEIYMWALSLLDSSEVTRKLASLYNNVGFVYMNQANYSKALQYFQNAYSCYDNMKDLNGSGQVLLNIGNINFDIGIYDNAHNYTSQALSTFMLAENKQGISDSYFQMGRIYMEENKIDRAQRFFNHALKNLVEINDKRGVGDCYQNLGVIFQKKGQLDSAEYSFSKALDIYNKVKYIYGIATIQNNLAGLFYTKNNTYKSIKAANTSLRYSLTYNGFVEQIDSYNMLSKAYEELGKYTESLHNLKKAYRLRDSIFDENTTNSLVELEVKHQSRNLKRTMEKQQLMLSKREAEIISNQREYLLQRRIRNILVIASSILVLLLIWNIRELLSKKQNNKHLKFQKEDILTKNVELEKLNEELSLQRSQIEQQHIELLQQKESIELINFHLKKDVKYANYIQQAILPSKEKLKRIVKDFFVFYNPKQMVGGDFYYATLRNNFRLIAVGDCTGHGVPGGFLTMLGMSLLKSIISEKNINQPDQILSELRKGIIEIFEQTGQVLEQSDSIDIAIVVIDDDNKNLYFAGSRANAVITSINNSVQLLKGDRIPVSYSQSMRSFATQTVGLKGNENIYFYTDGFTDQFNVQGMKFGRKRFIKLCQDLAEKPMTVQKEAFASSFDIWRNNVEQIDDALVFGFKVRF